MLVFEKRGKLEYQQWRKTSYNKGTNQPETHPTYGVNARINPGPLQREASTLIPLRHPRSPIINRKDLFLRIPFTFPLYVSQSYGNRNFRRVLPLCEQDILTYQQRERTKTYGLNVSEKSHQWIYHKDWVAALGVH